MRFNIIGGGPAGSYAALLLARDGQEVHVYEEHDQIGQPVQCTGIVTRGLWKLIPKDESLILTELKKVRINTPSNQADVKLHEYVLDRGKLDQHLADLAKKAGAEYHLGHRFVGFDQEHNVIVRHEGEEEILPPGVTIGADGANSAVAKASGLWKPRSVWGGVQATIEGDFESDTFDVFFGDEYENFFAWVVPESRNRARIGVAAQRKARKMYDRIRKKYPGKRVCWSSGPIPIYQPGRPVRDYGKDVFLVGDAAGLVKATTGGGIITGMVSSKLLVESFRKRTDYADELAPLHRDLKMHHLLRRMLNTFTDEDYDRLADLMSDQRVQEILHGHLRDFPTTFVAKLLLTKPRLLGFATNFIKQLRLPREKVSEYG